MAVYTTINDPSAYFKVQLYTGNGSANHSITFDDTDTDMQPDLVWIKNRDQADANQLIDSVRGVTKTLDSDSDGAEGTDTDTLDAFESDGFRVDADVKVNTNTENYVAWCWKESATSGLDIVTYTGNATARTISHNLSAVPHTIWCKERTANAPFGNQAWSIYHKGITANKYMVLNSDQAQADDAADFNDTDPTSSVFTVGNGNRTNASSGSQLAYVFAPIQGFSKYGVYEGNAAVDGRFVYTGFRPACIIVKDADGSSQWRIFDNKRGHNGEISYQYPSATTTESTGEAHMNFYSNGFKLEKTDDSNASNTYVYWAWAEAPFVNSKGVPCNAR